MLNPSRDVTKVQIFPLRLTSLSAAFRKKKAGRLHQTPPRHLDHSFFSTLPTALIAISGIQVVATTSLKSLSIAAAEVRACAWESLRCRIEHSADPWL